MTCADCGKLLDGQVCETDNPRPGRITVRYQGNLCPRCYQKRKRAGNPVVDGRPALTACCLSSEHGD